MDRRTQPANSTQSAPATAPDPRAGGWRTARVVLALYWIALAVGTHWPHFNADLDPPVANTDPINALQVDKGLHFLAFGLLGFLLIRARPWGQRLGPARSAAIATLIALVYAPIDEFTQALAVERTPSLSDLTANTLGILAVYLFLGRAGAQGPPLGRRLTGLQTAGVIVGGFVLSWGRGGLGLILSGAALAWGQWALLFGIGLVSALLLAGNRFGASASQQMGQTRRAGLAGLGLAIGWVALSAPLIEISRGLAGLPIDQSLLMAQEIGLIAAMAVLAGGQMRAAWHGQCRALPLAPNSKGAAA